MAQKERFDGRWPGRYYNIGKVKRLLVTAYLLIRPHYKFQFVPKSIKRQVVDCYYQVYVDMYDYILSRIRNYKVVSENDHEDIAQSIFRYLFANSYGFFKEATLILCNNKHTTRQKHYQIQNKLDRYIRAFSIKFICEADACRIIEDDLMDAQLVEDLTTHLNPEDVAILRYEREVIVNMLLTAPPWCRIDKYKYEQVARKYLTNLLIPKEERIYSRPPSVYDERHFNEDYVKYCIRRQVMEHGLEISDIIKDGAFAGYVEPTFSQILSDKLGIPNPYAIPKIKDGGGAASRYEEKHNRFVASVKNEQNSPKFLVLD